VVDVQQACYYKFSTKCESKKIIKTCSISVNDMYNKFTGTFFMAHNVEIVKIQQEYYLSDKSRKMTALMVQSFQRININPPTTLFQNTFSDV